MALKVSTEVLNDPQNRVAFKKIIDTITQILGNEPQFRIILFGSYATHHQTPRSDIDIAIDCQKPLSLSRWVLIEEEFENSDLIQKIDVLDYWRVQSAFQKVIDQTGLVLFIKTVSQ